MNDRETLALLSLLAKYATAYGKDSAENISVKELADDLVEASFDEVKNLLEAEGLRDQIYDGLNQ